MLTSSRIKMIATPFRKLKSNWFHYKSTHSSQGFKSLHYSIRILFYRHFLSYVIAIPLSLIYFLTYPFIKVRFFRLVGSAIGHYAVNTECLLAELDNLKDDKFYNLFYMENSLFEPAISNTQLHSMWKRIIFILPLPLTPIIQSLDKVLMTFLDNKAYGLCGRKKLLENRGISSRDIQGNLKKSSVHLQFTDKEHNEAKRLLQQINITSDDRFVCLLVRSNAYNSWHPTWNRPYRNADLSTYMKACEYLADKGYFVLRMGKVVDDHLNTSHPRIIDYARSHIRSDFMDIYLSAHCHFFITTGSGLDSVAQIFRRPILYTNCFVMSYVATWFPHYIFTPKLAASAETHKLLSFKENFYYLCDNPAHRGKYKFNIFHFANYLDENRLYLVDNTADELLDATQEMEARMSNNWEDSSEDENLQRMFWKIFPTDAKCSDTGVPLHGEISVRFGAKFLSKYQHLLN